MDNAKQAKDLVNILREANQEVDPKLADLAKIAAANVNSGRGRYGTGRYSSNSSSRSRW